MLFLDDNHRPLPKVNELNNFNFLNKTKNEDVNFNYGRLNVLNKWICFKHIVMSILCLMTSSINGASKFSRVHISATEYRQLITTCSCANLSE